MYDISKSVLPVMTGIVASSLDPDQKYIYLTPEPPVGPPGPEVILGWAMNGQVDFCWDRYFD